MSGPARFPRDLKPQPPTEKESGFGQRNTGSKLNWHLNLDFRCGVLPDMAEEKSRSKDIILWIITVVLIALAIFWYKR